MTAYDKLLHIAAQLRTQYPVGTPVRLIYMNDPQAPPIGTTGIVDYIDDMATVFVKWKTGSHLGVVYDVDKIEKVRNNDESPVQT